MKNPEKLVEALAAGTATADGETDGTGECSIGCVVDVGNGVAYTLDEGGGNVTDGTGCEGATGEGVGIGGEGVDVGLDGTVSVCEGKGVGVDCTEG